MHVPSPDVPVALLTDYRRQLNDELHAILSWWAGKTQDEQNGFFGSVNWNDLPDPLAAKGIVMFSRICWTFSTACSFTKNDEHRRIAKRAFDYINDHFSDRLHGGVYWSVDANGKMLDGKKQIYGQAFCIYAFAAYYKVTRDENALAAAKDLFEKIEQYSFDPENNGYIEALSQDWSEASDLRLSEKDENERKTANTHLHIIEAYAHLFSVWPDELLKEKIRNLLDIFRKHIISRNNDHLVLFFSDEWKPRSSLVSFGHDIEAAWLLAQCAGIIRDDSFVKIYRMISMPLTRAALRGLDYSDGGLWYEYDAAADHWVREKHWWPQAEAMVGFFYAWEISGEEAYLQLSINAWKFAKTYLHDSQHGEWFWGIQEDYSVITKEKAGFWKCPYHNGRACMELIRRISSLLTK
jgi:mannobiose 2-epimerase